MTRGLYRTQVTAARSLGLERHSSSGSCLSHPKAKPGAWAISLESAKALNAQMMFILCSGGFSVNMDDDKQQHPGRSSMEKSFKPSTAENFLEKNLQKCRKWKPFQRRVVNESSQAYQHYSSEVFRRHQHRSVLLLQRQQYGTTLYGLFQP